MQENNTSPTDTPAPTAPETTPTPAATSVVPAVPTPAATDQTAAPAAPTPTTAAHVPGAKNHLVAVLLSIFVGTLGVDRFYLGHIGLGVAKLLLSWMTFGIWWLIDVILVATRKVKNVTWES